MTSPLKTPAARRRGLTVAGLMLAAPVLAALALWAYLSQPMPDPLPDPALAASPARLEAHVRRLAEGFIPRDYRHPHHLDRAAAYLVGELRAAGGRVHEQTFRVNGHTYRNVIARFGPGAGPRVVVGAHYDAAGPYPGADDNASGVAGLLELARLLGETPPAGPVELVAYSLEETLPSGTSTNGSRVHARALRAAGVRVRVMLSLEMIGTFSDAPGSQRYPLAALEWIYPDRGDFIAVIGAPGQAGLVRAVKRGLRAGAALPVHALVAPRAVPGVDFSDHRSFWEQGYPAVMVTDTAFYRNPHYHRPTDTPERLDYRRMADVVGGVRVAVLALAGGTD